MTLAPGQTDVEHSHTDETVIFVKGGSAHIAMPDGNSMDAELPDGHIMWHEAWTHTVSNTGSMEDQGDHRGIEGLVRPSHKGKRSRFPVKSGAASYLLAIW
jgi:hypothetical protein